MSTTEITTPATDAVAPVEVVAPTIPKVKKTRKTLKSGLTSSISFRMLPSTIEHLKKAEAITGRTTSRLVREAIEGIDIRPPLAQSDNEMKEQIMKVGNNLNQIGLALNTGLVAQTFDKDLLKDTLTALHTANTLLHDFHLRLVAPKRDKS